jgi:hypothetical protein
MASLIVEDDMNLENEVLREVLHEEEEVVCSKLKSFGKSR